MELNISKSVFLEELSKASKVIDVKNLNPILSGVLIDVNQDELIMVSNGGLLSYKTILNFQNSDLEVKQTGKILIKPKYLLDMLRKVEDDLITLSSIEENELKITTQKLEFNISTLDSSEYPLIGFRERGIEIKIDPKEFKSALTQTFVSLEEWTKKIALTGANIRVNNNKVIISTTDMYRISQKTIDLGYSIEEMVNIIIPFKTVVDLPKFIENSKELKIIINEGYATFIIDQSIFQTNLIDGQFPMVESAFPKEFTTSILINTRTFLKTLNRAFLISEEGTLPVLNLRIYNDKIIVRSNIAEVGNFEEEFYDFKLTGESDFVINFNPKFLQDAIKTFDSNEIQLNFVSSVKPLVIQMENDESLKQVVLPTYLNE